LEDADKAVYGEGTYHLRQIKGRFADQTGDLAGIKVGHGAEDFEAGEDIILTLKDSKVLGEDGKSFHQTEIVKLTTTEDELQNVNMADDEVLRAAKERKRKAQEQYNGLDDDEFDEDRIGVKAGVLGKYDDSFATGKMKSEVRIPIFHLIPADFQGFRLGAPIEEKPIVQEDTEMVGQAPAVKIKLGLDFAKDFEVSDYMKEGDAGFKQRKKKKAKRSTRKADVEEEDGDGMDVDAAPTFTRRVVDDGPQNLVDDDDLQAALARSRRTNARSKPRARPEDLAAQSKLAFPPQSISADNTVAERKAEEDIPQANGDEDGRITFDDTSEFVRNVNAIAPPTQVKRERAATPPAQVEEPIVVKLERVDDEDEAMESDDEDEDDALAEIAAREGLSLPEYRLKIERQMNEISNIKAEDQVSCFSRFDWPKLTFQVEDEEEEAASTSTGMASVLNLLRQQGSLKVQSQDDAEKERIQKEKDLWMADFRRREVLKNIEKLRARGQPLDDAQREYEKRRREQQEVRDAAEMYKSYKPHVEIKYHDEFGRGKLLYSFFIE
jgi:U4/U6.U5 tri-snRNP-associated protein 1